MKYFFKIISIVCVFLISAVMVGCGKTGESKVEENIKRTITNKSAVFEKVAYEVNEEAHLGRINYKIKLPNGAVYKHTKYFYVKDNENVRRINTDSVPNDFLSKLEEKHPKSFARDVSTYQELQKLEKDLKDSLDEAEDQKEECLNNNSLQMWYDFIDTADNVNEDIDAYTRAHMLAPYHVSEHFMTPPQKYNVQVMFNYWYNGRFYNWFVFY